MRLFIDLNILLDVALQREGEHTSGEIIKKCHGGDEGWIAWHTLSVFSYFVRKKNPGKLKGVIDILLGWAHISETGDRHARMALQWDFKDFEDALQAAAALACQADFIITRNLKDFTKSPVPALSPEQYLARHH